MSEYETNLDALREELQGLRERQAQADCAEAEGRVVDRGQWLDSMRVRQQRIEELEARGGGEKVSTHLLLDETNPQPEGEPCPPSSPTP